MPIPKSHTRRRVLLRVLPAVAALTLCAVGTPSQAADVTDARHQEIINRADGGRLSSWDDATHDGVAASTIREPNDNYEARTSTQWELEQQNDGTWLVRNEKNAGLCLQPTTTATINAVVVLKRCTGERIQTWQIVPEETDLDLAAGSTGWWSLRPADNPMLAAAPVTVGGAYSGIRLFRATNSADRLWHHQSARHSW
ncbi:RICIN domain-containing protein [Streptomyces sp. NPDC051578]|uniref:RICIN domain-containing protein n=1 Tax=Streptomyces sp. NPDC051578 TaxID=3365662 RepID=UPI0037916FE9